MFIKYFVYKINIMKNMFFVGNKIFYLEIVYCSIDINNIETYLKRIESIKKEVYIIPAEYVLNQEHIKWGVFMAKNRFFEKINFSKNLFTEVLMVLAATKQINKIKNKWYLKKGKNLCFVCFVNTQKKEKNIQELKKLEIKKEKMHRPNFKKIKVYYKIKECKQENEKELEKKIIEKMALSFFSY